MLPTDKPEGIKPPNTNKLKGLLGPFDYVVLGLPGKSVKKRTVTGDADD